MLWWSICKCCSVVFVLDWLPNSVESMQAVMWWACDEGVYDNALEVQTISWERLSLLLWGTRNVSKLLKCETLCLYHIDTGYQQPTQLRFTSPGQQQFTPRGPSQQHQDIPRAEVFRAANAKITNRMRGPSPRGGRGGFRGGRGGGGNMGQQQPNKQKSINRGVSGYNSSVVKLKFFW